MAQRNNSNFVPRENRYDSNQRKSYGTSTTENSLKSGPGPKNESPHLGHANHHQQNTPNGQPNHKNKNRPNQHHRGHGRKRSFAHTKGNQNKVDHVAHHGIRHGGHPSAAALTQIHARNIQMPVQKYKLQPLYTINFNMILAPPIWKSCKEQIACLISFEHLIDTDALSKVEFCKILNSLRKYKKPENIKIFANSNSFLFVVDYMILATCQSSFLKAETFGTKTTALPAVSTLTMNSGKTGNESPSYEAPPIVDTEDENEENDDSNSQKSTTLIRGSSVTSRIKLDISKYHSEQNLDQCISLFANALTSPDAHQTLVKHLNKDQKIDFLSAIHSILLKGPNANMQHRAVRFLANLAFTQDLFLVFSNVQLSQILYKLYKQIQGFPRAGEGANQNPSTSINNAPITPGHPTRSDSEFMADIIRCIRQLSSIKKIRIFMVQNYTETIVATIIKLLIQEKSKENSRLYKECLRCLQLFSKTATKTFSLHLMQYKDLLQDFVNEFSKNTDIGLGLFETPFQFFSFV